MTTSDKAELQKIAQQVEISRERLQAMEQQIKRLEDVKLEQNNALQTLQTIPKNGAKERGLYHSPILTTTSARE